MRKQHGQEEEYLSEKEQGKEDIEAEERLKVAKKQKIIWDIR
jgi:hypothetical protein